ncbi:hypothetical protein IDH28_00360 [Pelagibacterales bacterium SAG-MED31]|nr:hypothetical protein [Pelagibacterales bacterium SAG-MED31]
MRLNSKFKLPKIIGHRGVKDLAPENTLESILKAFELGLECVEVDVKISKDNVPLLIHDDTLDRTTSGAGLVCNYTFDELMNFDAGNFFYKSKTNIKIPSLSNVLKIVSKNKKYINIELKPNEGFEIINVDKIINEINKFSLDHIFFSSFDLKSCIRLKEKLPDAQCGFLNDDFSLINPKDTIDICKKYNFISCGIDLNSFSKSIINDFINHNIIITVYSGQNISLNEAKNLWSNNVTSVFVDDPTEYLYKS